MLTSLRKATRLSVYTIRMERRSLAPKMLIFARRWTQEGKIEKHSWVKIPGEPLISKSTQETLKVCVMQTLWVKFDYAKYMARTPRELIEELDAIVSHPVGKYFQQTAFWLDQDLDFSALTEPNNAQGLLESEPRWCRASNSILYTI